MLNALRNIGVRYENQNRTNGRYPWPCTGGGDGQCVHNRCVAGYRARDFNIRVLERDGRMTKPQHTPGNQKRHPFSYTLGAGPYKYVGSYDMGAALAHQQAYGDTASAFRDAPCLEAGMGTCAHCGHAILDIRIVRRGDGKLYGVGSDCILKVADQGDVGEISKLERQIREDRKIKRRKREEAKVLELENDFQDALDKLEKTPHPNSYFAEQGKTMRDYYEYCTKNSKNMKAAIAKAKGE